MSFVLNGQAETHRHYQEIIDAHQLPDSTQGLYSILFITVTFIQFKILYSDSYTDVIEAYLIEMKRRNEDLGTFTMEQLHHVLADMFGAGTDTALTTIKWIVLYMILHPDIQVMNQGFPIDNECRCTFDGNERPWHFL